MMELCDRALCTGCQSCFNSCPKGCISLKMENGYLYPAIDDTQCIECGRCRESCPVLRPVEQKIPRRVFAAACLDLSDYKASSSGGMATLLGKKIILQGGIVYGAAFVNQKQGVRHVRVNSLEGLERLRGSKYVHSEIGTTYRQVAEDLKENRTVLFVGTPCQVAGLYRYLGTRTERLITIDLVCHGTPPYAFLREHLERRTKEYDQIIFRVGGEFRLVAEWNKAPAYTQDRFLDMYYLGFLKGLTYRKSCYSCEYATSSRCGDITLGDFWGYRGTYRAFPFEGKYGLSLVMLNSEKGQDLFENCQKEIACEERTLEEAVEGNTQLRHPANVHRNREKFLKLYKKRGFDYAAKQSLFLERMVYGVLYLVEQFQKNRYSEKPK